MSEQSTEPTLTPVQFEHRSIYLKTTFIVTGNAVIGFTLLIVFGGLFGGFGVLGLLGAYVCGLIAKLSGKHVVWW